MTEFGSASEVPDADRGEQVPAVPGEPSTAPSVGYREADDADVLEQETEVPVDDDEIAD